MSSSFTIPVRTAFILTWTLTDSSGAPINSATVKANLYAGRSRTNPDAIPGTVVPPISNLTLAYVGASAGIYSANVPATLDPPLDGTGYVLVIDGSISSTPIYHSENPVVIETAGSNLDLTSVDMVKEWLVQFGDGTTDDATLQLLITSWGWEFLRRTGQGDQGGDYTQSPFNGVFTWNETYDGGGTDRLMLNNRPVKSILSLSVNGQSIPQSSGFSVAGWVIDGAAKSVVLRGGGSGFGFGGQMLSSWQAGAYRVLGSGLRFWQGVQNIAIQYTAGYASTPADVIDCANEVIGLTYQRRARMDERSRAVAGGGGSISWYDWIIPPKCEGIVNRYTRTL